jgi:solute carrier family 8 (sodium/calcium exchanger)
MKYIYGFILLTIVCNGVTNTLAKTINTPIVKDGVSQWKYPKCTTIEEVGMSLKNSGNALTKSNLQGIARCTTSDNVTCCGDVKVLETTEGVLIQAFRPHALKCGISAISTNWFPSESIWSPGGRLLAYGFAMIYCFLGIAIIADRFMVAIEVITSAEVSKTITLANGEKKTIKFLRWNETVANLTLMALGSSAPEILLAIGETVGQLGQPPSDGLGPATIVGSAAFNLLAISAICVVAIPEGEERRIDDIGVFCITASFSLFAYIWMYICLSDSEVTIIEAVITIFWMYPLIQLSYCADRGWPCCKKKDGSQNTAAVPTIAKIRVEGDAQFASSKYVQSVAEEGAAKDERYQIANQPLELRNKLHTMLKEQTDPSKLDPEVLAKDLAMRHLEEAPKSRMYYRINARRGLTGGKRLGVKRGGSKSDLLDGEKQALLKKMHLPDVQKEANAHHSVFEFAATHYNVFENEKFVSVKVLRSGDKSIEANVHYETSNGTALAGVDYDYSCGELIFKPNETEQTIKIAIVDDNEYEPDENFFIRIYIRDQKSQNICGGNVITEVTIINDDEPGEISFDDGKLILSELSGMNKIKLSRKNGSDGQILLKYKITPKMAEVGSDYNCVDGEIVFAHMEMVRFLDFEVLHNQAKSGNNREVDIEFTIDGFPECGVKYGLFRKTTVCIVTDVKLATAIDNVTAKVNEHLQSFSVGTATWAHQFSEAVTLHGEHGEEPSTSDLVFHFLSINWKVLFAFVPPTSYLGGWACFISSLAFIGGLTVFVGDIAGTFGCLLGLSPTVTAITFVALGTSLPDTFASYEAAIESDNADASIGNVTGSNSVNVFLGQGLPWLIASIYYASRSEKYEVSTGDLGFSLVVFLPCALICILLFFVRRYKCGGELGGPVKTKQLSALVMILLWVVYVIMSTLQSQGVVSVSI